MYQSDLPAEFRRLADDDRRQSIRYPGDRVRYLTGASRLDLAAYIAETAIPDPIRTPEDAAKALLAVQDWCRSRCCAVGSLSHCECRVCEVHRLLMDVGLVVREVGREGVPV